MGDPFARLGTLIARIRWPMLIIWVLLLAAAGSMFASKASSVAKGGGFDVPGSQSEKAAQILEREFGSSNRNDVVVVFHSDSLTVKDAAFEKDVTDATERVKTIPEVTSVLTYFVTRSDAFVSTDGHTTTALVSLAGDEGDVEKLVPTIRDELTGVSVEHYVTGFPAINHDTFTASEHDLRRSEIFTIPIVLILLLLVFRTVVASMVPLVLGACSVILALAGLYLIGSRLDTSIFALNVASMIGLGLGIDFSLILVSRFREERSSGFDTQEAVARTVATAGRSITYSALTVILSMGVLTLLLRDLMIVRSISMGVMLVAVTGLVAGLTLLPALLAILGDRLEWLRVMPRPRPRRPDQPGIWYRFSHAIMRRPWRWLLISLFVLFVFAAPVRHIRMVGATTGVLPPETESAKGADILDHAFADNRLTPIQIVMTTKEKNGIWNPDFLAAEDKLNNEIMSDRRVAEVQSLSTFMAAVPRDGRFEKLSPIDFDPAPQLDANGQPIVPGATFDKMIDAVVDGLPFNPAYVGLGQFTIDPGQGNQPSSVPGFNVIRLQSGSLTVQATGKAELTTAGNIGNHDAAQEIASGNPLTLKAGDQLVIYPNTKTSIQNSGPDQAQFLVATIIVVRPGLDTQNNWFEGNPSADLFTGLPRKVLGGAVATKLPSGKSEIEVDHVVAQPGAFFQHHIHTGPELVAVVKGQLTLYAAPEMTVTAADGTVVEPPFDEPMPLNAGSKALVQAYGIHRARNTTDQPAEFYSTRVFDATKPAFILTGVREIARQFINIDGAANTAVFTVIPKAGEYDKDHQQLVYDLRNTIIPQTPELKKYDIYVGGEAASFLDFRDTLYNRFPLIIAVVAVMIFFILMMFFQSIFLPLKAMFLNLMSILATYGLLVVIFQYDWGTDRLLGFQSQGMLNVVTPAVLYVILFALSTDYEVFMLSRVKEYYHETGDNEEAVASGLESTAGVITAAGLILVGTFGSFATADVVTIKEIGLGLAIGVLIDSTIVRVIMVPATMRLLGEQNWWMPEWLKHIIPELREGPSMPEPVGAPALAMAGTGGRMVSGDGVMSSGASRSEYQGADRSRRYVAPAVAHLRPVNGSLGLGLIPLSSNRPLTIGRDEGNDLQLFDGRVSRFHARISYADGQYIITDLGSSNGVFVNGQKIEPEPDRKALRNGDHLDIGVRGAFEFVFELRPGS